MLDFRDRVAVVTGAASGIGYGIAEKCAKEGMKVVLAGINEDTLARAESSLESFGTELLTVQTDVSKSSEIERLANITFDSFGAVNLLFNNAGVGAYGYLWECSEADWEWVIKVNLMGVINGVRVFVPRMLSQDGYGHVINTASVAGFLSTPFMGVYQVTKHGVVTLSETLYHELGIHGNNIGVSVLCPGFVKTKIIDAERNRPKNLPEDSRDESGEVSRFGENLRSGIESGISVETVADITFEGIRNRKFYIFTHPEYKERFQTRFKKILNEQPPTTTWSSSTS
jgi:short-subunit dehydrogenase